MKNDFKTSSFKTHEHIKINMKVGLEGGVCEMK